MKFGDSVIFLQGHTVAGARLDAVRLKVKEHIVRAAPRTKFHRAFEAVLRNPDAVGAIGVKAHEFHAVAPPTLNSLRLCWVEIHRLIRGLLGVLCKGRVPGENRGH